MMQGGWGNAMKRALFSGSVASIASTMALAICGRRDVRSAATPLNGPSQWIWGSAAPYHDGFSVRHTLVGYAIHHLASVFWATAYERFRPHERRGDVAMAAAVAATASVVDFDFTPHRLRPGFEKRLSQRSLVVVYTAFAAGLAIAALTSRPPGCRPARGR
jgi:hypothetical protein